MKREGIGPCVCCAVRMVYVVLTQRRRSYAMYSGVPHVTTPIYTPHLSMSLITDEGSRS